ncbi:MAG TPA: hypothetical protein VLY87_02205 [Flavobacterium sp.]|nr:hypothetical protein [Flavobacterium sp.]
MTPENKPIKRHPSMQQFSRDHHFGLLLSWKIRQGIKKNIALERMKAYAIWTFEHQIKPHFDLEEVHLLSLLSEDDALRVQTIKEHRVLEALFNTENFSQDTLSNIEELLDAHIRFEERILFNHLQQIATPEELARIEEKHHEAIFKDDWQDEFWT